MNIIEEIKKERIDSLDENIKKQLLNNIRAQLKVKEVALIRGGKHFRDSKWCLELNKRTEAPYKFHAAIAEYLESLGFRTSRYINGYGVDYGMNVYIP